MAVEIMWDSEQQTACMWDTTTDTAFGPVFSGPSANVEIGEFLDWAKVDPRSLDAHTLAALVETWCDLPTVNRHG